ncbi:MAG TPA: excinuclease ABC subunit UvrC [Kiritimatiellia bacterium]|nr:excinuclease ABC subunit UvrC [Kiritimatiellia bacterium]HNS80324.1 excinuclease ABC subunit UvrC [Kiritimatiellia bacterium]HQQ04576.1 excinuclease ABC subunit UvrC [Kiritimatiellia bacterium]
MKVPSRILEKLKKLPDSPGVYIMRDRTRRVIYVGKAVSLRSRVRSYFQPGTYRKAPVKVRGMINSVADFDFLELRTEEEAALTEGRLIKDYKPRYNILLKDDKRFPLIRVDLRERFPRFERCRLHKEDGAHYFGPYANSGAARAAREFVERRFGLRNCPPASPDAETYRHCHNDVIRYCSAPCIGKVSRDEYLQRVEEACAFLRGERVEYLHEVRAAMQAASEKLDFEKASALRDTLFLLQEAVKRRSLARKTPLMKQESARAGVLELQAALNLPRPPAVIEAYDISNISGTFAVASMVSSVNGIPQPGRYRLYRIRTVQGSDDPAMMAEVVKRRYSRLQREGRDMPDLVLVDGGITQVRAAARSLRELGLSDIPVAGLAKRFEELVQDRAGGAARVLLPLDSCALTMVQQLRDEAHRFALTFHRRIRGRRIRESILDDIPGIGPARKALLLRHFGSVRRMQKATVEEMARVPGLGRAMAELVCGRLAKDG